MAAMFDGPILSKPVSVMGEHYYTQKEFCSFILHHFKQNLRDYEENPGKAVKQAEAIACESMQITGRYFCRPLDALNDPINPQQQSDLIKSIGMPMLVKAAEQAVTNAGITLQDVSGPSSTCRTCLFLSPPYRRTSSTRCRSRRTWPTYRA